MKRERPLKLNNYIKFLYRHSKRNSKYKIPYSKSSLEYKNKATILYLHFGEGEGIMEEGEGR